MACTDLQKVPAVSRGNTVTGYRRRCLPDPGVSVSPCRPVNTRNGGWAATVGSHGQPGQLPNRAILYVGCRYGDLVRCDLAMFGLGHRLVEARGGIAAERAVSLQCFDLILFDDAAILADNGRSAAAIRTGGTASAHAPIGILALRNVAEVRAAVRGLADHFLLMPGAAGSAFGSSI